jgi:hypothetical protein
VALYNWFHLGQNLMPAVNDLLLGYLLYKSRLVPRVLPLMGLIGAPLLVANTIATMFGIKGPIFVLTGIGVLPIALFEFFYWVSTSPSKASNLLQSPLNLIGMNINSKTVNREGDKQMTTIGKIAIWRGK